ncbi:MAG: hypothetical protein JNL03_14050 [Prolixibacteraceae bacterium]|nr:hypothetical protein [Prolixibacteraceae bacterium]
MCRIKNIKNEIAREYGFDHWDEYFECFGTTEPGRMIIQKGINRALCRALHYPEESSCSECVEKKCDSKDFGELYGESVGERA